MDQKNRTLIVDAQLFQSYTYHRGMGKYSLSLLRELNDKLTVYTNKVLLFNNISGYLSKEEMAVIQDATPGFSYEFLSFQHMNDISEYEKIKLHNRNIVDDYIKDRLGDQQIDFLILSLFQETELPVFPSECNNKYVLVYDLIPIQFFKEYLWYEPVIKNYLNRFGTLIEADHFFTISRSVASDVALQLGVPKSRITPIYGAPVQRKHLNKEMLPSLKNKKFILLPSGDDFRKNNLAAARAFEEVNHKRGNTLTLVITSAFTETSKTELAKLSNNICFTGNVSENQLAWLYEKAELVFFPSLAEGLGLPILEAIEFHKKVVCSNIPAFKEIDESTLFFCDPYNQGNITKVLEDALMAKDLKANAYDGVLTRYDWSLSAQRVNDTFVSTPPEARVNKKKIAIFSPKPDGFSGVGKVVQEQHYCLSRYADVTYFFENGVSAQAQSTEIRINYLKYATKTDNPWSMDAKKFNQYDLVIYHIGNGEYHVATLLKALAFPSHVVLHDTRIKGLHNVARSIGVLSIERYNAEQFLNDKIAPKRGEFLTSLVSRQKRVIVHSTYSKLAVQEALVKDKVFAPQVVRVNLAIPEPYYVEHNNNKENVYIALAGLMTESKGIDLANTITNIKDERKTYKVKIFGFSMLDKDIVHQLEDNKNIELIQSPSDIRYLYELSQSDIMLNFRHPYHGETSYSTLEGLRFGKNVIVNNTGWFSELPDDIVYKVDSTEFIEDTIKTIILKGLGRESIEQTRIDYIIKNHNVQNYIQELIG